MYNLETINQAKSYDLLKRNGFTDEQAVRYYNMPSVTNRTTFFTQIKEGIAPKIQPIAPKKVESVRMQCSNSLGTQKCTMSSLKPMIVEYMMKDFVYRGKTYNMQKMGWKFNWINTRNAFGRCHRKVRVNRFTRERTIMHKEIQLSKWLIANSESTFEEWCDTMLHEIAHAIDVEIRGTSDHSNTWKNIAVAVGARPERTTDVEVSYKNSKYTLSCANGHKTAGHKYSRTIAQGRQACPTCCDEHNGGKFSRDYLLTQTQNY